MMPHETLVLGAGMIGVSVAYHLAQRSRDVCLVDRRPPGRETSYGNAGIIQREAVVPHAFPRDMAKLIRLLSNRSVDVRYSFSGVLSEIEALFSYWRYSAPKRFANIVPEYASLIALSLETHEEMINASGSEELIRRDGWMEIFRTPNMLSKREAQAQEIKARFGVSSEILDSPALHLCEPNLGAPAIGAVHWQDPWTVTDPGALVAAYAKLLEAEGGEFQSAEVKSIAQQGSGWRVSTSQGVFEASEVVLALGPWVGHWLKTLNYKLPIFVKRGYHMHYSINKKLYHWLLDAENGYLMAPMRAGIRLTTGVELAPHDAPPAYQQLEAAETMARKLFPLGDRLELAPWKGARPCTPDMKPIIGPAPRHAGLWFAFGHAHQGFTLGPATGRLLAALMSKEEPDVDMAPFSAERFFRS